MNGINVGDSEALRVEIDRILRDLEKAKAACSTLDATAKQLKPPSDASRTPKDVASMALGQLKLLQDKQRSCTYIQILVKLKRIESKLMPEVSLSVIRGLCEDLSDTNKLIDEAMLHAAQQDHVQQRLSVCRTALQNSSCASIKARLQVQKDGSYIPPLEDTDAVANFTTTMKAALEIHQSQVQPPEILDIFQVMVLPFTARFIYHFCSRRPTNRLDKPEWFLQHILSLLAQYHPVMVSIVQPLLHQTLPSFGLLASHEFIRALLPMVTKKVHEMSKQLLENTALSQHMIAELKGFDDTLREDFGFCHRDGSDWTGIVYEYLTAEVFEAWCTAEEMFVHQRFLAITEDQDAFEIIAAAAAGDVEGMASDVLPNPSATKIIDLIEATTFKFTPLEDLWQRQQVKVRIQSKLLNDYLDKIRTSTDAFETLTSGFSGGFPTTDVAGKAGLQRLCRQLSGVSNVLTKLLDWHDDPFYIALDDAGRTEAFQVEIDEYKTLKGRIEALISAHLTREFTQELKTYARAQNWSIDETPLSAVASTNTSSAQLFHFYESIAELFGYLSSVGSVLLVHRIYASVAAEIDRFFMSAIIQRTEFSRRGALQFKRDILQIWFTFSAHVARPESGMRAVSDALLILSDGTDDQERRQLQSIESVVNPTQRTERETQQRLLREAGIVAMAPVEVRSLLQRKLFSIERQDN